MCSLQRPPSLHASVQTERKPAATPEKFSATRTHTYTVLIPVQASVRVISRKSVLEHRQGFSVCMIARVSTGAPVAKDHLSANSSLHFVVDQIYV